MKKFLPVLTIITIILIAILLPKNSNQPTLVYTPMPTPTPSPYVQVETQESSQSGEVYDSFLVPKDLQ